HVGTGQRDYAHRLHLPAARTADLWCRLGIAAHADRFTCPRTMAGVEPTGNDGDSWRKGRGTITDRRRSRGAGKIQREAASAILAESLEVSLSLSGGRDRCPEPRGLGQVRSYALEALVDGSLDVCWAAVLSRRRLDAVSPETAAEGFR